MIRRYASHFLYLSVDKVYKQQIVELQDGVVHNFFPFQEELHSVVWLGGSIILSDQCVCGIRQNICLEELVDSLKSESSELPTYAYFLKGVNIQDKSVIIPEISILKLV